MSRLCPCTSKKSFDQCCEPFISGKRQPETAEKLMRSRFTAYALGKADYLAATTAAAEREKIDLEDLKSYCQTITCISLKIVKTEAGKAGDEAGTVLFHASLQMGGRRILHRELSRFVKEEGAWKYVDGDTN